MPNRRRSAATTNPCSVRVSAVSLDQVIERCAGQGPLNLVKMDVEGAETDILEGAAQSTLKKIRQFVLEYHTNLSKQARARCELAGRCRIPLPRSSAFRAPRIALRHP